MNYFELPHENINAEVEVTVCGHCFIEDGYSSLLKMRAREEGIFIVLLV